MSSATFPVAIAFDGTSIWTANLGTNSVTRINPATGAFTIVPLPSGSSPGGVVSDGTNIWITNSNLASVYETAAVINAARRHRAIG